MYTQRQIEEANAMDITRVARDLGLTLKRQGVSLFAQCLWHDDRKPSMQVGGKKNVCHCYSCGETHSVLDLVMRVRGCNFKEAMEWLIDPPPALCILPKGKSLGREPGKPVFGHRGSNKSVCGHRGTCRYGVRQPSSEPYPHSAPPKGGWGVSSAPPKGGWGVRGVFIYHVNLLTGEISLDEDCRGRVEDFYPNMDNSLSVCLLRLFPREVVEAVTSRYGLGLWTDRMFVRGTMFPSIDLKGRCHNIKVQEYETRPESERFMHRKGNTVWLGSLLQKEGRHVNTGTFDTQALFGEHLLTLPGTVALVESPKNAVVGACQWPDLLWVAVGNKSALTAERLQPLKGRNVLVFPDKDALTDWQERLDKLRTLANFHLCTKWMDEVGEKGDIADWVVKNISFASGHLRKLNNLFFHF